MRRDRSPFEYRGQWLGQEGGRSGWYRYWYDERGRKVARRALAAASLEAAKDELVTLLGAEPVDARHPAKVLLSDVLNHYVDHKYLPGRRAAALALTAMETVTAYPKVADLTLTNQRTVWAHMRDTAGLTAKSIATYMIAVRAAVNFAAWPQIVRIDGREREVRLLTEAVPILCHEAKIAEHCGIAVSGGRRYLPTHEQIAAWLDAIEHEADFRYALIALNTWARNSAIFDLRVDRQVDFDNGLVDLNPPGRRQTKKRRPVIRLTANLRGWLLHWRTNRPIKQYQDTVEKRLNAIGPTIGQPDFVCYTLRHFMATQCRRTSVAVSREQRSRWLGHTVTEGSRTTDWYEQFDPDYLESVAQATDEIIAAIGTHTRHRRLIAPTVHPQTGLAVVAGGKKDE